MSLGEPVGRISHHGDRRCAPSPIHGTLPERCLWAKDLYHAVRFFENLMTETGANGEVGVLALELAFAMVDHGGPGANWDL